MKCRDVLPHLNGRATNKISISKLPFFFFFYLGDFSLICFKAIVMTGVCDL